MSPNEQRRPGTNGTASKVSGGTTTTQDTAAQRGMATALDAVQPVWRHEAEAVLDALITSGADFTADDVRDVVGEPFATGSARALGGIIGGRFRRGEIEFVRWSISRQPQRHQAPARVWRGVRS